MVGDWKRVTPHKFEIEFIKHIIFHEFLKNFKHAYTKNALIHY